MKQTPYLVALSLSFLLLCSCAKSKNDITFETYFSTVETSLSKKDISQLKKSFVYDEEAPEYLTSWDEALLKDKLGEEIADSLFAEIETRQLAWSYPGEDVRIASFITSDGTNFRRFFHGDAFAYYETDTVYPLLGKIIENKAAIVASSLGCMPCMESFKYLNGLSPTLQEKGYDLYAIFHGDKASIDGYKAFGPYFEQYGFIEEPWTICYSKRYNFFRDELKNDIFPSIILFNGEDRKDINLLHETEEDLKEITDSIIAFIQ